MQRVGLDSIYTTTAALTKRFEEGVLALGGVQLFDRHNTEQCCGIVALTLEDFDAAEVSNCLSAEYDICTRAGAHCAPLMHLALNTGEQGAVRFSFSHFNTGEEIEFTLDALKKAVTRIRRIGSLR